MSAQRQAGADEADEQRADEHRLQAGLDARVPRGCGTGQDHRDEERADHRRREKNTPEYHDYDCTKIDLVVP